MSSIIRDWLIGYHTLILNFKKILRNKNAFAYIAECGTGADQRADNDDAGKSRSPLIVRLDTAVRLRLGVIGRTDALGAG